MEPNTPAPAPSPASVPPAPTPVSVIPPAPPVVPVVPVIPPQPPIMPVVPPPAPPAQPAPTKPSSNLFWILLVGMILIGLAAGWYVWQRNIPVSDPVAVVEAPLSHTYVNNELGFSVEVPPDWTVKVSPTMEARTTGTSTVVTFTSPIASTTGEALSINFRKSTKSQAGYYLSDKTATSTINGITYMYYDYVDNADCEDIGYESPAEGGFVNLFTCQAAAKAALEKMLSTLKFTSSVVEWKTYKSSKLGVEFQYPGTYEILSEDKDLLTIDEGYRQVAQVYIRASTTVADMVQSIKDQVAAQKGKFLSQGTIIIDGRRATQVIAYLPEESPLRSVVNFVIVNDKLYEIVFYLQDETMPYNRMLSSIKFTK